MYVIIPDLHAQRGRKPGSRPGENRPNMYVIIPDLREDLYRFSQGGFTRCRPIQGWAGWFKLEGTPERRTNGLQTQREWARYHGRRPARYAPVVGKSRPSESCRHEIRLRHRHVWRVYD